MRNPRNSIKKPGESCPRLGFLNSNVNEYITPGRVFLWTGKISVPFSSHVPKAPK